MILDRWQEEVLEEEEKNIVVCAGRQTGKSQVVAIKAAKKALQNPSYNVLIVSVTEKQAEEMITKILAYLDQEHPKSVGVGKDKPLKHRITLKNGSVIRCEPIGMTGAGVRGFTVNMLVCDEAAFMPQQAFAAITPMLLTTGGQIILISTPKGRQGYFYDSYCNKEHFRTWHVNSEEVAQGRSEPMRTTMLEYLKQEKKRMSSLEYEQEYMGEFIEKLGAFFQDKLIRACMKRKRERPKDTKAYYLGVDVARLGGDEITYQIIDRTNRELLKHVESIAVRRQWLTDTVKMILRLHEQYHFRKIYVDDGGVGVAVYEQLLLEPTTKRIVEAVNNSSRSLDKDDNRRKKLLKEDLYSNLLRLMEQEKIELLDDDEVYLSLKSIQYEYTPDGNLRIFGSYSHIAEGLIRACWCTADKRLRLWVR